MLQSSIAEVKDESALATWLHHWEEDADADAVTTEEPATIKTSNFRLYYAAYLHEVFFCSSSNNSAKQFSVTLTPPLIHFLRLQ